MAQAKSGLFGGEMNRMAATARALAHPVRIRILRILAERDVCICGEIVDLLPLSQSTVSQHLKALKKAGLIKGEEDGPKTCYCLDRAALGKALKGISGLCASLCACDKKKGERK
jgi:DNA-binding transcriptional ArsR family regulator